MNPSERSITPETDNRENSDLFIKGEYLFVS